MAIRTVTLSWNTASGRLCALTGLSPYLKRGEPVRLIVHVDALITDADDLSLTLKPRGESDGTPLLVVTGWTWSLSALTWTADATITSAQIDTLLAANADAADDAATAPVSIDIRALDGATLLAASDTLDITLKNQVGSAGDGTPESSVAPDDEWVAHGHAQTLTSPQKSQARVNIGATTVGAAFFGLANPGAITFVRINADNSVTALSVAAFRTALGLGSAALAASSAFDAAGSAAAAHAVAIQRANHTGTQAQSTVTNLVTDLAAKAATETTISATGLATGGGTLAANRTIDVPSASQGEAEAGSDNTKAMTPLRTQQHYDAQAAPPAAGRVEVENFTLTPDGAESIVLAADRGDLADPCPITVESDVFRFSNDASGGGTYEVPWTGSGCTQPTANLRFVSISTTGVTGDLITFDGTQAGYGAVSRTIGFEYTDAGPDAVLWRHYDRPEITEITAVADVAGSLNNTFFEISYVEGFGEKRAAVWFEITQEEITVITCVADVAGSLQETYFIITGNDTLDVPVCVWFNVAGGGMNPGGFVHYVEVPVATNDELESVAIALDAALALNGNYGISTTRSGAVVTATYLPEYPCGPTVDGAVPTLFTFDRAQDSGGGGTEPPGFDAAILVSIAANDTAATIGIAAAGGMSASNLWASLTGSANELIVVRAHAVIGGLANAIDGSEPTGFTINVIQNAEVVTGEAGVPDWSVFSEMGTAEALVSILEGFPTISSATVMNAIAGSDEITIAITGSAYGPDAFFLDTPGNIYCDLIDEVGGTAPNTANEDLVAAMAAAITAVAPSGFTAFSDGRVLIFSSGDVTLTNLATQWSVNSEFVPGDWSHPFGIGIIVALDIKTFGLENLVLSIGASDYPFSLPSAEVYTFSQIASLAAVPLADLRAEGDINIASAAEPAGDVEISTVIRKS